MNYTDILNDPIIINKLADIDEHNANQFNHGLGHVKNVMANMIKLAKLLAIDKNELNYLLIACVLHDLGQREGSEEHYLRSKTIAANYLKDKIDPKWFNIIVLSIENHHDKNNVAHLSLFEHLVLFADKMDFTFQRLDVNYLKQNPIDYLESHILDVNFEIVEGTFNVIVTIDQNLNQNDLANWSYYPKIEKRIEEFAAKLKLGYLIQFEVPVKDKTSINYHL